MKIPKLIRVGGHDITIKLVKSDDMKQSGDYDTWYDVIRINMDSLPESSQAEILLHEILEAISKKYNLELEHKTLTIISESLFAIIRNNKLDFIKK